MTDFEIAELIAAYKTLTEKEQSEVLSFIYSCKNQSSPLKPVAEQE